LCARVHLLVAGLRKPGPGGVAGGRLFQHGVRPRVMPEVISAKRSLSRRAISARAWRRVVCVAIPPRPRTQAKKGGVQQYPSPEGYPPAAAAGTVNAAAGEPCAAGPYRFVPFRFTPSG
jgi:hypothetical protein